VSVSHLSIGPAFEEYVNRLKRVQTGGRGEEETRGGERGDDRRREEERGRGRRGKRVKRIDILTFKKKNRTQIPSYPPVPLI
jgi:hypothetical protein